MGNNKAPTSVMNMVKDIGGQLKGVFKNLSWQERQKRSMVEHKMMVVEKLQKEERRVSEDVARTEEQLQNRKALLKKQEEQEAMLKAELNSMLARGVVDGGRGDGQRHRELGHQGQAWLGGPAQGLSPGGGAMSSAFYKGMAKLSPANSFLGERLDSSRRSVGSGAQWAGGSRRSREDENSLRSGPSEFLQMKTPAAWYKPGPLRSGPSPR